MTTWITATQNGKSYEHRLDGYSPNAGEMYDCTPSFNCAFAAELAGVREALRHEYEQVEPLPADGPDYDEQFDDWNERCETWVDAQLAGDFAGTWNRLDISGTEIVKVEELR